MLWDLLESIFGAIGAVISYFVDATVDAGISPDIEIVLFLLIVLTFWLSSGCWAGAIAGSRKRSVKLNFIAGMLFPLLYPVIILFALDVRGAKQKDQMLQLEFVAKQNKKKDAEVDESSKTAEDFENTEAPKTSISDVSGFDMKHFKRIALDDEGNPTGPWAIETEDSAIVAKRIIECLPQVVVLEIQGAEDKLQRIRIPYARIKACNAV